MVKPAALADLGQTVEGYESQQAGLGRRFVTAFDQAVARLELLPLANPIFADELRWRVVRPFQSIGIFHVGAGQVDVVALIDPRRDPESIPRQLRKR